MADVVILLKIRSKLVFTKSPVTLTFLMFEGHVRINVHVIYFALSSRYERLPVTRSIAALLSQCLNIVQ